MQILGIILIVVLLVFLVLLLYKEEVPVVGGRDDIFFNVDKYHINQSLLAIPTATPHQKRDILNICKETCYELKQLPGVYQLVKGEVSLSKMKKVAVEDEEGFEYPQIDEKKCIKCYQCLKVCPFKET